MVGRPGGDEGDVFIRRLRIFLGVVEVMNVSAAARALGVSQPAVSQQIRALEEMLDTRLFNRIGRELHLTETGRKSVLIARRLVEQVDGALAGLRARGQQRGMYLRLGFSAPQIALPIARQFKSCFPGASLQLVSANSGTLFEQLRQFELDAIFVGLPAPHPEFECINFLRQRLIAIVSREHPLAARQSLSLEELCSIPLVFREKGSYTRRTFFEAAHSRGLEPIVGYEIASREAASEAVALGLGMGTVFEYEAPPHPAIKRIPIEGGSISGYEYLVCYRELTSIPPVSLLLHVVNHNQLEDCALGEAAPASAI